MRKSVAFYISGHGFGHAVRAAEILRVLTELEPGITIHIRTHAPARFFPISSNGILVIENVKVDTGVVELDPLRVDPVLTLENAASFIADKDTFVGNELAFVRQQDITLILGDMPYFIGDIAEAAGVPCLAIGNFSWDWIYEPFVTDLPAYRSLIDTIRRSYRKVTRLLMLPFSDKPALSGLFCSVINIPLLARQSKRAAEDVKHELSIEQSDDRPLVLIGMRGGVRAATLVNAARAARDWLFLTSDKGSCDTEENIRHVVYSPSLQFVDILKACSVVIAKLGYGIVAESCVNKTRLLYTPRFGFREDQIIKNESPRHLCMRELPLQDYEQGAWLEHLNLILKAPLPTEFIPHDGAELCAKLVAEEL